jgi:excisionase family DNA binding protein
MIERFQVEPNDIYDDAALVLGLGVTSATLRRARRNGHLRATRKGKHVLYRGQWVLDWLEQSVPTNGKAVPHAE